MIVKYSSTDTINNLPAKTTQQSLIYESHFIINTVTGFLIHVKRRKIKITTLNGICLMPSSVKPFRL